MQETWGERWEVEAPELPPAPQQAGGSQQGQQQQQAEEQHGSRVTQRPWHGCFIARALTIPVWAVFRPPSPLSSGPFPSSHPQQGVFLERDQFHRPWRVPISKGGSSIKKKGQVTLAFFQQLALAFQLRVSCTGQATRLLAWVLSLPPNLERT